MSVSLEDIMKLRHNRYDSFDVMRWLVNGHKSITKTEEISLLSLIAYTAMENDISVEEMQRAFLDSFSISRVEQLRGEDYNDAVQIIMAYAGEDTEEPRRASA